MASAKANRLVKMKQWIRFQLLRLVHERATARNSSLGFALGTFIGIVPTFAIGAPLALFLAARLQWSRGAALAGTLLMNPITAPFFYWLSAWLGLRMLPQRAEIIQVQGGLGQLREFGAAFFLGSAVVALVFSAILGFFVYLWLKKTRSSMCRAGLNRPRLLGAPSGAIVKLN
jgi:uncharacterized protein (DUF2062 family)